MQLDTQQLDVWAVKRAAETSPMTETKHDELAVTAAETSRTIAKKPGALGDLAANAQSDHQPKPKPVSSLPSTLGGDIVAANIPSGNSVQYLHARDAAL